jgi:ribonuclease P protein component
MDNSSGHPRMGLIVPKFQSSGVARNRLRRRLTEIWRRELQAQQGGRDLLIRARKEAYGASFADLRGDLLGWVEGL